MTESITVEGRGVKINARGLAAVAVVVGLALVAGQAYGVGEVGDDTRAAADDVRAEVADLRDEVRELRDQSAAQFREIQRAIGRLEGKLDSAERTP